LENLKIMPEMTGLEEKTIQQFRSGRLGMKTIFRCAIAWLDYKRNAFPFPGRKHTLVSIVIPVYNQAETLEKTVEDPELHGSKSVTTEIILIEDGSTDGSALICDRLSEKYKNVRCIHQKNQGVSSARNAGIRAARGKYILYLDADDSLQRGTLENLTAFFNAHYKTVDLVTYPIRTFYRGRELAPHFRYQYLTSTGIYDLEEYAYIGQTTMNIMVKNLKERNHYFNPAQSYSEDQRYCCEILAAKRKMGFCKEAAYLYHRRDGSFSGRMAGACFVFEQCMEMFEDLFSLYGNVPLAVQGLYVNDLAWKLSSDMLFPYHYSPSRFVLALERIKRLLSRCENQVILDHPQIDWFEKFYFLRLKGENSLTPRVIDRRLELLDGEKIILSQNQMEIVITKFFLQDGELLLRGFLKSVFFQFYRGEYHLMAACNGEEQEVFLYPSAHCYYQYHEPTQRFDAFYLLLKMDEVSTLSFRLVVCEKSFPVTFYFLPLTPFSNPSVREQGSDGNDCSIRNSFSDGGPCFAGNPCPHQDFCFGGRFYQKENILTEVKNNEFRFTQIGREQTEANREKRPLAEIIWLYYDCVNVPCDNGLIQFRMDEARNDGVRRFYVITEERQYEYLTASQREKTVRFGSEEHQKLFLSADKILTAFIEENNIIPFPPGQYDAYANQFRFEVIYLQHGVLHIHMPWKYSPEKILADRVVVSTRQEAELYVRNGFLDSQLLRCGMPRFGELVKDRTRRERTILYIPSWRKYLVSCDDDGHWQPMTDRFLNSSFYRGMRGFLESGELKEKLREEDWRLEVKPHPIFEVYREHFAKLESEQIKVIDTVEDKNKYRLVISDVSSFIYDYLYLGADVMLFLPDYEEFSSGMNGFRKLNLDRRTWEKTAKTAAEITDRISGYLKGEGTDTIPADFYEWRPLEL